MMVNNLKEAVKNVLGSCVSLGFLVESKEAKEIVEKVSAGEYDSIIKKGSEIPSPEKVKRLQEEFEVVKAQQEAKKKAEEEAKAAEELKEFTAIVEQANALQKTVYSILNNIDSAIAQVNRQMKSVDMGIRTQSIITASASDWDNSEEFDEESSIMNDCNHSELDEE